MNEVTAATSEPTAQPRRVFISYATADRKRALALCTSLERRGTDCWISTRDVQPGENYQEAIVRSIRDAPVMVLLFSAAANSSDEIKKELSLASRYRVPVIALRSEDVEPSDAFAYELSTRQWIDAFEGWDTAVDTLAARISQLSDAPAAPVRAPVRKSRGFSRRGRLAAAAAGLAMLLAAGGWWLLAPPRAAAHSMTVRLASFQPLSPDLPRTIPDSVGAEVSAAFNADGVIGVSTAPSPQQGTAPAYALGGTIQRVGESIRVITRFTNERSGVVLWSDSIDYPAAEIAKIPRRIAVDAGIVVRCGLSGAATYHKALPDPVLKDYMQYCQESWAYGGTKTLLPAQRVVAAVPDFSWGWSAVQTGYMQASFDEMDPARAGKLRAAGLEAANKALALDPRNSEALDRKTYLIEPRAWARQEALYKAAIAAKPLDCGCQHYGYGLMLRNVGRMREAVEEQRIATNMLSLWPDSQLALAAALLAMGNEQEARAHFDEAVALSTDPTLAPWIASAEGVETGDYAGAIAALHDPRLPLNDQVRGALLAGYRAMQSRDSAAKAKAISALRAVPADFRNDRVVVMLAALGDTGQALAFAVDRPWLLWQRSMRGVLDHPGFPATARKIGLMDYWKASKTRPDVCGSGDPPFCRLI